MIVNLRILPTVIEVFTVVKPWESERRAQQIHTMVDTRGISNHGPQYLPIYQPTCEDAFRGATPASFVDSIRVFSGSVGLTNPTAIVRGSSDGLVD